MVKEIPLQNGMVALVDDEDWERCMEYTWSIKIVKNSFISVASTNLNVTLQKFILKNEEDNFVAFSDGDQLNFSKSNLRFVNKSFGIQRGKGHRNSSSKYKGVSWVKARNRWLVTIYVNGRSKWLGYFLDEDEAAKTYNEAAKKVFGEHAYQNVIGKDNNVETIQLERTIQNRSKGKSGFRGVHLPLNQNKWICSITINRESMYIGSFDTAEQAAEAYDKKAFELHGDKAILNFPNE